MNITSLLTFHTYELKMIELEMICNTMIQPLRWTTRDTLHTHAHMWKTVRIPHKSNTHECVRMCDLRWIYVNFTVERESEGHQVWPIASCILGTHSPNWLTEWKRNSNLSSLQWFYNSAKNNARIDPTQHTDGNQNRILFHPDGPIVWKLYFDQCYQHDQLMFHLSVVFFKSKRLYKYNSVKFGRVQYIPS